MTCCAAWTRSPAGPPTSSRPSASRCISPPSPSPRAIAIPRRPARRRKPRPLCRSTITAPTRAQKRIFSGWMYASSPGLNGVEHPLYDVWVISCIPMRAGTTPVAGDGVHRAGQGGVAGLLRQGKIEPLPDEAGASSVRPSVPRDKPSDTSRSGFAAREDNRPSALPIMLGQMASCAMAAAVLPDSPRGNFDGAELRQMRR